MFSLAEQLNKCHCAEAEFWLSLLFRMHIVSDDDFDKTGITIDTKLIK